MGKGPITWVSDVPTVGKAERYQAEELGLAPLRRQCPSLISGNPAVIICKRLIHTNHKNMLIKM